jgi:hypothetical protein
MATTPQQNNTPATTGKNTVMRPLNIVTRSVGGNTKQAGQPAITIKKRAKRQLSQAAIAKQLAQAEQAQKRADNAARRKREAEEAERKALAAAEANRQEAERLEREAQEAELRAQREAEEQEAIRQDSVSKPSTVHAVPMTPDIEVTLKRIKRDFETFFKDIEGKYGYHFQWSNTDTVSGEPTLVKRGFVAIRIRGDVPTEKRAIATPTTDLAAQRSELRFMKFHKDLGLNPGLLNKEVRIKDDNNTYIFSGLRGKANSIVLKRKDNGDLFLVPNEDFKKILDKHAI